MIKYILFLIIPILAWSCKTTNLFTEEQKEQAATVDSVFMNNTNYQYHIRKDDKITISIWGQDEISVGSTYGIYNSNEVYGKWLMVDAAGNIEVPRIGTLNVENLTIIEFKTLLKKIISEWVKNPIIDVKILNREITVLGEVRDPQVINIDKERNTLLETIARCKGFEFYANVKRIKVLRQVGTSVYVANIDMSKKGNYLMQNINLYAGDVVIVPSKKHKDFDKRVSTIIPFTTTITAAAIFMGLF